MNTKAAWQQELSRLVTSADELFSLLDLDPRTLPEALAASRLFPLRVTHSFIARMKKGNPNDPLLLQVLPLANEQLTIQGYTPDPLRETEVNPIPGLLHKYQSRVLVTLTGVCAIHCRYCFRRSFPYHDNNPGRAGWGALFDYIQKDSNINEVIISGGDPLAVTDDYLSQFMTGLSQIPNIKRLRLHTRLPVVLPARITSDLIETLTRFTMKPVMVLHVNHANELDESVRDAIRLLQNANITLLNQSVLLKNVNDTETALVALSERLFECGVLPYYLHTLDKVNGAAHFDIPLDAAKALHVRMKACLPGYLVPRLVTEMAGEVSKTWV